MTEMEKLGKRAKAAVKTVQFLGIHEKNEALIAAAEELEQKKDFLIKANKIDIEHARAKNMSEPLIDRLTLTEGRIKGMADGLRQIAALPDPVGEVTSMKVRPNGLRIGKKRVPLGVVGIIYEARPNVTADAFGLCFMYGYVRMLVGGLV